MDLARSCSEQNSDSNDLVIWSIKKVNLVVTVSPGALIKRLADEFSAFGLYMALCQGRVQRFYVFAEE